MDPFGLAHAASLPKTSLSYHPLLLLHSSEQNLPLSLKSSTLPLAMLSLSCGSGGRCEVDGVEESGRRGGLEQGG